MDKEFLKAIAIDVVHEINYARELDDEREDKALQREIDRLKGKTSKVEKQQLRKLQLKRQKHQEEMQKRKRNNMIATICTFISLGAGVVCSLIAMIITL